MSELTRTQNGKYAYLCRLNQEDPSVIKYFIDKHYPTKQPSGNKVSSYTIYKDEATHQWGIHKITTQGDVVVDVEDVGPQGARGVQVLKLQRLIERMRGV